MKIVAQRGRRNTWDETETALTLLELLVVIAIIGVLVSLLLPTLSRAKLQARDRLCLHNFRQLAAAHRSYLEDYGRFPPAVIRETNPPTQLLTNKSVFAALGGVNPGNYPLNDQYPQATNRPLYRYQGNPMIFRCSLDRGYNGDLDWPHHRARNTKPTAWEAAGSSYLYNISLEAPRDPTRSPPLPVATLQRPRGIIARKTEAWVEHPDRFILMHEPPAQSLSKYLNRSHTVWTSHWQQWHRYRIRTDFRDPRIAPALFVAPVLFVDGHAALHDFSRSLMTDPWYPYEETKDWQWYQPR